VELKKFFFRGLLIFEISECLQAYINIYRVSHAIGTSYISNLATDRKKREKLNSMIAFIFLRLHFFHKCNDEPKRCTFF